jgi:hypothetical protein
VGQTISVTAHPAGGLVRFGQVVANQQHAKRILDKITAAGWGTEGAMRRGDTMEELRSTFQAWQADAITDCEALQACLIELSKEVPAVTKANSFMIVCHLIDGMRKQEELQKLEVSLRTTGGAKGQANA